MPRTRVPLSPQAITPANAGRVEPLQCLQKGVASGAAFSPDGVLLAWACDRNLGLYRVQDGVRLRSLPIPEPVRGLAFSADGMLLAASTDNRIRVHKWDQDRCPCPCRGTTNHEKGGTMTQSTRRAPRPPRTYGQ